MCNTDDLLTIFLEEARELLNELSNEINTNTSLSNGAWRAAHTLKGASRMVGLTHFSTIAYSLELLISSHKPESEQNNIKEIQSTFSQLEEEFTLITHTANNARQ